VAARSKDDALWLEPGEKGANYPVGIPWVVGRNAVLAILKQSPKRIIKLFMAEGMGTERRLKAIQDTAREHGLTVQYVERPDLDKRCEQLDDPDIAHQGVLAEVLPKDAVTLYELIDRLKAAKDVEGHTPATQPLIIALDKITDPRNVGAILRVADGVGAMAVIMPKRNQAGWGPALSKSASGADATVDIVMVPNLVMALKDLKDAGGWVVGAAGEEDTELYTDYKFDRPTVLVMGSEGDGLSRLTRATCDYLVRIPMMGAMTSLNVSTATAVLAYGWRSSK
jgi:23S rRNA (guanosine2251-2'-O)-methyltransferase